MLDENLVVDENSLVRSAVSTFTVENLTARLIEEYDTVYFGNPKKRSQAADVAAILARHFDEAYELVTQSALKYARLSCEVGDFSPYSPNGIDVMGKLTNREKARYFLESLRCRFMGLAQSEATLRLANFDASARSGCEHVHSRDWKNPETWQPCMNAKEKHCLATYFAVALGAS
jgi:hypothetical protein